MTIKNAKKSAATRGKVAFCHPKKQRPKDVPGNPGPNAPQVKGLVVTNLVVLPQNWTILGVKMRMTVRERPFVMERPRRVRSLRINLIMSLNAIKELR